MSEAYVTNYRLKDGDEVTILEPARVDWYIPEFQSWTLMHFLPGTQGRVVRARTPCVTGAGTRYFANVDIDYMGSTYRVRVAHETLKRNRRTK